MKNYFISKFLEEEIAKALKIPVEDVMRLFVTMMVTDGIIFEKYEIYGTGEGMKIVLHFEHKDQQSFTDIYNPRFMAVVYIERLEEYLYRESEAWIAYKAQIKREKLYKVATSKGRLDLEQLEKLPTNLPKM